MSLEEETRVRDIANKWNNIRENVDRTVEQKLNAIGDYVLNLEKRINDFLANSLSTKIKKIIGDLEADISKERLDFHTLDDRQAKAVTAIDRSCKQVTDDLRSGQQDWNQGIMDQIDDR